MTSLYRGCFSSKLHFCIAINDGKIDFRISRDLEVRVPILPQNANLTQVTEIGFKVLRRSPGHPKDATKCDLTRNRESV